jgi:hypothetical protein
VRHPRAFPFHNRERNRARHGSTREGAVPPKHRCAARPLLPFPRCAPRANLPALADPAHARRLVSKLLPLVRAAGLTPGAHPLLALVRLQQEFLLDDLGSAAAAGVDWDMNAAVRNAAAVCAGLDVVLAPGHPVRALARAELGKLLAADEPATASPGPTEDSESGATWPPTGVERVALAARILAHAHEELCIGFGSASGGGVVGREVRALAQRLESEMGALKRGVRNVREFG